MTVLQAFLRGVAADTVHRKVTLTTSGATLTLPITSPEVTHSNLEADWKQVTRLGAKPFIGKAGGKLKQIRFSAVLQPTIGDVDYYIRWLEWMANGNDPVFISYGKPEAGPWVCTSLEVVTTRREFWTNNPTRATATFTFTETIPLPGASALQGKPVPAMAGKSRVYTVRGGDSLSSLALRFYFDAAAWLIIAVANHLRGTTLHVGQRLIIP